MPMPMRHALGGAGGSPRSAPGVPAISVLGALLTTLIWEPQVIGDAVAVPALAWGCAVLISAGALLTSLKLASMHHAA